MLRQVMARDTTSILGRVGLALVLITLMPATSGSVEGPVAVTSHGARCDGDGASAEVDTLAMEVIAASGHDIYLPANNYCILKRPITLHRAGQRIIGDDPTSSKILVYDVFGSDGRGDFTTGVLNLDAPGQEIVGIGLSFQQPNDPKGRSGLKTYQPAIRARRPATRLSNLLISGATTCIDMGGGSNAGNSYLNEIGTGCYDYGIRLDGSLDTVHIRAHHSFPFQMNPAQAAIFTRKENVAIDLGRVDDYAVSDSLCLGQTCLNFYTSAGGGAFGTISGYDFDGAAVGIQMASRYAAANVASSTFSAGTSSQHSIVQSAGRLTIGNSTFFGAAATVLDQFDGGIQTISNSLWNGITNDASMIISHCVGDANKSPVAGIAVSPCHLTLLGNTIERDANTSFKTPWLWARGDEVVTAIGNFITANKHASPFMIIVNDTNGNRVSSNAGVGWLNSVAGTPMVNSLSATAGGGLYFGN